MTYKKAWKIFLYALAGLCCLVLFFIWAQKGLGTKRGAYISPKGWYRVEFYTPFALSSAYWAMATPTFIKVYDQRTNKRLYESDIVDTGGDGVIFWPDNNDKTPNLSVGMNISIPLPPEPGEQKKVESIRSQNRKVVGLVGKEEVVRITYQDKLSLIFRWEYEFKGYAGEHPTACITMFMNPYENLDDQLKIWDTVLDSMKSVLLVDTDISFLLRPEPGEQLKTGSEYYQNRKVAGLVGKETIYHDETVTNFLWRYEISGYPKGHPTLDITMHSYGKPDKALKVWNAVLDSMKP